MKFLFMNPLLTCLHFLQIFFLQGRIIFGPDARSVFLTMFLIVAPVSIFCAFVARKLTDDFSDSLGISVMVIAIVFTLYVSILIFACFSKIYWNSLFR